MSIAYVVGISFEDHTYYEEIVQASDATAAINKVLATFDKYTLDSMLGCEAAECDE